LNLVSRKPGTCLTLVYARQHVEEEGESDCPITKASLTCKATYEFEKYIRFIVVGMLLVSMCGWMCNSRGVHWIVEASLGVLICALLVVYLCYKQMATARDAIPGSSVFKLAGAYMVSPHSS
jgi:hypothetical protein